MDKRRDSLPAAVAPASSLPLPPPEDKERSMPLILLLLLLLLVMVMWRAAEGGPIRPGRRAPLSTYVGRCGPPPYRWCGMFDLMGRPQISRRCMLQVARAGTGTHMGGQGKTRGDRIESDTARTRPIRHASQNPKAVHQNSYQKHLDSRCGSGVRLDQCIIIAWPQTKEFFLGDDPDSGGDSVTKSERTLDRIARAARRSLGMMSLRFGCWLLGCFAEPERGRGPTSCCNLAGKIPSALLGAIRGFKGRRQ